MRAKILFFAIFAFLFSAGGALALSCTSPDWREKPTSEQLISAWPPDALKNHQSGKAEIGCALSAQGTLHDCVVISENPPNLGFGRAAISVSPKFQMNPKMCDGQPVESKVTIPVSFSTPTSVEMANCTNPDWRIKPTARQLLAGWPAEAAKRRQGGKALMECVVSIQGALRDCTVVSETPPGLGFGHAAVALSSQFVMTPKMCNGAPRESKVTIPVNFDSQSADFSTGSRLPGGGFGPVYGAGGSLSAGGSIVSGVRWTEAPSYKQVAAALAIEAVGLKSDGHVAVQCQISGEGRLVGCKILSEIPAGAGLGKAAMTLTKDFLAPTSTSSGLSLRNDATVVSFTFSPAMLGDQVPVTGKPQWARLPESLDIAASFPAAAKAAHVTVGHVALSCLIGQGGELTDCVVTRQSPEGLGFDKAALALSTLFQMTVWTDEGLPTIGSRVEIPLRYEAGASEPPAHP